MATYYVLEGTEYKEVSIDDLKKSEKLVAESDALTLKGSLESTVKKLEKDLADAKTNSDSLLARALTAESTVEERQKELEPLKAKVEKHDTLETELNALKEKHLAVETQLLTNRRNALIEKYQLKDENKAKIESMTAEQLTSAEEAASLFGNPPQQNPRQTFDRNNGNRGNYDAETSALDDLKAGISEIPIGSARDN